MTPYTSYHLIFLNHYISLWDWCSKFLKFQNDGQTFDFLGIIHYFKSLFFFPSQILVCATAFVAHYLFSFWDLYLLSSLSNKNKKRVGRNISTSLRMYQNQHDYWLIIHDKLEDRFTTITQRCQDFSHKDKSAKITS